MVGCTLALTIVALVDRDLRWCCVGILFGLGQRERLVHAVLAGCNEPAFELAHIDLLPTTLEQLNNSVQRAPLARLVLPTAF